MDMDANRNRGQYSLHCKEFRLTFDKKIELTSYTDNIYINNHTPMGHELHLQAYKPLQVPHVPGQAEGQALHVVTAGTTVN